MWYPRSPSLLNYLVTGDLFQWPGSSVPSVVILRLHDSNNLGCPLLVKRKSSDSLSASRTMIFTPLIFLTREKNTPHIEQSVFLPVCVGDLPAGAPERRNQKLRITKPSNPAFLWRAALENWFGLLKYHCHDWDVMQITKTGRWLHNHTWHASLFYRSILWLDLHVILEQLQDFHCYNGLF